MKNIAQNAGFYLLQEIGGKDINEGQEKTFKGIKGFLDALFFIVRFRVTIYDNKEIRHSFYKQSVILFYFFKCSSIKSSANLFYDVLIKSKKKLISSVINIFN